MIAVLLSCNAQAFDSPEHRDIGDAAWQLALSIVNKSNAEATNKLLQAPFMSATKGAAGKKDEPICAVVNGQAVTCFSFGDLVAIYGDYAKDVAEVNSPSIVSRAPTLKQITANGTSASSPAENRRMIELAKVNVTHFSGEALKAYVLNHDKALQLAADKNRLCEALHYEALALHSFTDLFAYGHMIEDRETTQKLVDWANQDKSFLALQAANAGSSLMGGMVNFYHNAGNWKGAMVKNAAGEQWRAYGDGMYFNQPKQREIIVKATAASLWTVLNVALGNPVPPGTRYEAVKFLPYEFWDARDPVHPKDQMPEIAVLAATMQKQGRPIQENGFDFSLGILKYQPNEKKGTVNYLDIMKAAIGK